MIDTCRRTLLLEALSLQLNENRSIVCPWCNGGSSNAECCSIKRVEFGILYNCYRATCGKRGIVGDTPYTGQDSSRIKPPSIRRFEGALVQLPAGIYEERFGRYQIPYDVCIQQGIKYAPDIERLYMPVFDVRGYQTGEVLRAVRNQTPKTLFNRGSYTVPGLHFPLRGDVASDRQPPPGPSRVILVEDQVSAIKVLVCTNFQVAALLGTHLSDEGVAYLKSIGIEKVGLMLDGDEAGRRVMFKLGARLESVFKEVRLLFVPTGYDPKDMSLDQLNELIW